MDKKSKNIRSQKIFIEPLEQRIMLDGAGASTFLDLIDERNQQEIKKIPKIKTYIKREPKLILKFLSQLLLERQEMREKTLFLLIAK